MRHIHLALAAGSLTALLGLAACVPPAGERPDASAPAPAVGDPGAEEPAADEPAAEPDAVSALPSEPGAELVEVEGRVQQIGEQGWALVPDGVPGTRYAVDDLPPELREDGLEVVFSGVLGEIPPNVRLWGTPLELTSIRRAAP